MDQFRHLSPQESEFNRVGISAETQQQSTPRQYNLWNNMVWSAPNMEEIRAQFAELQNPQYLQPSASSQLPNPHHTHNSGRNNLEHRRRICSNTLDLAMNPFGCVILENKIKQNNPQVIDMVFSLLKDHIPELMVHRYGNIVVQALFHFCTPEQMYELLLILIHDQTTFQDICFNAQGAAMVQVLLKQLTTVRQKFRMVYALHSFTVALAKNDDGYHIIENCLMLFNDVYCKPLIDEITDHSLELATDETGCLVIQHCLKYVHGKALDCLILKIAPDLVYLSGHQYGNYVVQWMIELRRFEVTEIILSRLHGHFISLSMDKYASNVVEKCMQEGFPRQVLYIIQEIAFSPDLKDAAQDEYGNYVIQSAILVCEELSPALLRLLNKKILENYPFLHSHPHGKRVLVASRQAERRRHG